MNDRLAALVAACPPDSCGRSWTPALQDFEADLDALLAAKDRAVSRSYDAASCGTGYDFRRSRDAESVYLDARDGFIAKWGPK